MEAARCAPRCAGFCTRHGMAASMAADRRLLYWRALDRLRDAGLAEEAVQETFTRGWRACHRFDEQRGTRRSWLIAIEHNVIIDLIRARSRRPQPAFGPRTGAATDEILDETRPGLDPAETIVGTATVAALLGELSLEQREAIVETVLHDRPYAEVAAELGLAPGTLKSRVFYGLRRLRASAAAGRADPGPASARLAA